MNRPRNWLLERDRERARLQSCRKSPHKTRALAPEGRFAIAAQDSCNEFWAGKRAYRLH